MQSQLQKIISSALSLPKPPQKSKLQKQMNETEKKNKKRAAKRTAKKAANAKAALNKQKKPVSVKRK